MTRMMKDSGSKWLGAIPKDWKIASLGKVCEVVIGSTPSRQGKEDFYENGKLLWIKPNDLQKLSPITDTKEKINEQGINKVKLIPANTPFICCIGTIGKIGYCEKIASCNQQINAILFNQDLVFWKYGLYFLASQKEQAYFYSNGNVMRILNTKNLKKIKISLPKIEEQIKIANYLDQEIEKVEVVIKNIQEIIKEYKNYRRALITEVITRGVESKDTLKDTNIPWLGKIPKNWKMRKLKSFMQIISKGNTPKIMNRKKNSTFKISYFKAENIQNGSIFKEPSYFIDEKTNKSLKRSQLNLDDLLLVIAGATVGKVAIMPKELLPANINQAICFLRLKDEWKEEVKLFYFLLESELIKEEIKLSVVKVAQPNLSMEKLGEIKVPISPSFEERRKIVALLDEKLLINNKLIEEEEKLIQEFEKYKESLIFEVVTGKKVIL